MDSLFIENSREGSTPLVALRGELDRLTAALLDKVVLDVSATNAPRLILDLAELEFVDSAGLSSLTRAHNLLRSSGRVLVIRAPSHSVLRLFEIVGLHEILVIEG